MPIYTYKCTKCEHVKELSRKIVDRDIVDDLSCDSCNKKGVMRKVWSGSIGLSFKGSGWYVTDYKRSATPTEYIGGPSSVPSPPSE